MARSYTLKRRAQQQVETRLRIVEAAVELHTKLGPAATTFSMVAEKAGVQRHTLYAYFPDERSLLMACSGHVEERDPVPDAAAWRDIVDPRLRLVTGLRLIYAWFERNEVLLGNVLRDAERDKLHLALSFYTWRSLVREAGLKPVAAVDAMVGAVNGQPRQ